MFDFDEYAYFDDLDPETIEFLDEMVDAGYLSKVTDETGLITYDVTEKGSGFFYNETLKSSGRLN